MDILSIGEILIDLTQTGVNAKGVPLYAANPGGAPANLSVAAARLGARTAFIGKVGDDAFGRYLTDVLKRMASTCLRLPSMPCTRRALPSSLSMQTGNGASRFIGDPMRIPCLWRRRSKIFS